VLYWVSSLFPTSAVSEAISASFLKVEKLLLSDEYWKWAVVKTGGAAIE
jgi:hypothetical protein